MAFSRSAGFAGTPPRGSVPGTAQIGGGCALVAWSSKRRAPGGVDVAGEAG
jgi:hypothetical protein